MSESEANIVGRLILILFLTLVNAFFAASEMAIVSADRYRLSSKADEGDNKAKLILDILNEPSKFLSSIQVGITFAGFFSSASAAVSISKVLGDFLAEFSIPFAQDLSFIVITLLLSYITLVFGELVPKRIALKNPEKFAMFVVKPISSFSKIMKPFVNFLSFSTNKILQIIGFNQENIEQKITIEEISSLIEVGHEQGVINPIERDMIKSVISFDNSKASEIMTPRTEVFMIDINRDIKDYIEELLNLKYSRIPVYKEDIDNIIGILYLKDYLLEAYKYGFYDVNILNILREPYFVPENKSIDELFIDMKRKKIHMAILIDEYGGFSGIVTMEDLIEEIVGDIDDEYDYDEPDILQLSNNSYLVRGSTSIRELNNLLDLEIIDEENEFYDTVGGFLIYKLGYIPEDNSKVSITEQDVIFTIEEIKEKKIEKVKIELTKQFENKKLES
ncbi:HlyC/CorC family transporter [Soehngenia longivitae]|uniref:HlyC/CorC family transporter n=1 Tax=Soehngenia longivitae TaxID=2562294 RepID=A0A4Z0D7A3_9FIRM|nr:hemolysin family protein [Soehngenia longivitae]TFZ40755.1 HlyC/CorC family transporter [Soehngenia longivitae]